MGELVSTTDLYESTFYLLGGCELRLDRGRARRRLDHLQADLPGEKLGQLQLEYFSGKAKVPLFGFRRAFGQVNALVYSARKRAKGQLKQEQSRLRGQL